LERLLANREALCVKTFRFEQQVKRTSAILDQPYPSPRDRIISQFNRAYFPLDRPFSHQIIDFFGLFLANLITPA